MNRNARTQSFPLIYAVVFLVPLFFLAGECRISLGELKDDTCLEDRSHR